MSVPHIAQRARVGGGGGPGSCRRSTWQPAAHTSRKVSSASANRSTASIIGSTAAINSSSVGINGGRPA
eukprot:3934269-Rhodomonas_salina.4